MELSNIPRKLIAQWLKSDRSEDTQKELLLPYRYEGTVVCSDSTSLSLLTQSLSLLEVLKIFSEPKEIIHAYGKAIGGEAIGFWFAF